MLQSRAKWNVRDYDRVLVDRLVEELKISPLLARMLAVRGIAGKEEAVAFLSGGHERFHDPFLLDGMREAADRIRKAVEERTKIRIYGDYDADGVCSTSIMIHVLGALHAQFDYYIPHRANEGYGLNRAALDHAAGNGVDLIVTVDTGISSVDEVAYASTLGMDVVVTDHHEPPERLPHACALVNPKKPGCPYPFKSLAGAGVALKLAQALLGDIPDELFQFAAIGTIADLMPLTGENRILVKEGLARIRQNPLIGIKALLGVAGIEHKDVTSGHIGYSLAPRINASGRLENAMDAVKLLTSANEQEAEHFAFELDRLNKERQKIVEGIMAQALRLMGSQASADRDKVIVLADEDWNVGVVGIAASRILEKYYRPTLVFGIDAETGMAKGSARSIAGFDIVGALAECADILEHYGGHHAAAGMTLHKDRLPELKARLNRLAEQRLSDADWVPVLSADLECGLDEITLESIRELDVMSPFGMGNPSPRLMISEASIAEIRMIGKEQQHLKMTLVDNPDRASLTKEAIAFGDGALYDFISPTAKVDIIGGMSINEWNGVRKPQLIIQDICVPHRQHFDWRGKGGPGEAIAGLVSKAASGRRETHGVVVFRPDERRLLPECLMEAGCTVWTARDDGTVEQLYPLTHPADVCEIDNLYFYSFPDSLDIVRLFLREASGVKRIYSILKSMDAEASPSLPSREGFKNVYKSLLLQKEADFTKDRVWESLSRRTGLSVPAVRFILDVFEELSLVERRTALSIGAPPPRPSGI